MLINECVKLFVKSELVDFILQQVWQDGNLKH